MLLLPEGRRTLTAVAYDRGPARWYQPAYRYIAADIGVTEGAWLDLGCGPGWLCVRAAEGHPELDVVGIDTSDTMLGIAARNRRGRLNVTLRKMDAAQIVYPAGTFRVVTAVQAAHHWTDPGPIFAEAWRVLSPGGAFYVYEADPDADIPAEWIERTAGWPPDALLRRQWRRYGMDAARWSALLDIARASPFGHAVSDERHGFYRRLVCTR
jgi:ubiquinone/menaquinone biosynthesis C-methylase UbiE